MAPMTRTTKTRHLTWLALAAIALAIAAMLLPSEAAWPSIPSPLRWGRASSVPERGDAPPTAGFRLGLARPSLNDDLSPFAALLQGFGEAVGMFDGAPAGAEGRHHAFAHSDGPAVGLLHDPKTDHFIHRRKPDWRASGSPCRMAAELRFLSMPYVRPRDLDADQERPDPLEGGYTADRGAVVTSPKRTLIVCGRPSSIRRIVKGCVPTAAASTSAERTPRITPSGFSTVML